MRLSSGVHDLTASQGWTNPVSHQARLPTDDVIQPGVFLSNLNPPLLCAFDVNRIPERNDYFAGGNKVKKTEKSR